MTGLASLQYRYIKNKYYKNINTLLDIWTVSYKLRDSMLKNGFINESEYLKIKNCGTEMLGLKCKNDCKKDLIYTFNSCNSPICPRCRMKKGRYKEIRLKNVIKQFRYRKLLTLSFVNSHSIGREVIKKYVGQFNKVMKKLCVRNYVRVVEVKSIGKGYNIHIHSIVDHPYIPIKYITKTFKDVTKGESFIADIRQLRDNHNSNYAAFYISKYLCKFPVLNGHMEYYQFFTKLKKTRFMYCTEKMVKEKSKYRYDVYEIEDKSDFIGLYNIWFNDYFESIGIDTGG